MTDHAINALLIEDNPLDARLIREHLSQVTRARVALECADSLSAGMERLRKAPPDVLLLDLGLPESQALDTLSRVLAEAPRVPVVVITSLDDEETAYQAVGEGAQDYLVKGRVDGDLLVRSMRYAIERQRSQEALRQLRGFNQGIVQNMGEGVIVLDQHGNVTFTNPSADTLLGYEPEELLGSHWTRIAPADQHPIVQAADARRAQGESDRYELDILRKDGTRLTVLVSGSPRLAEGALTGTLAVFTDITEVKKAQGEIGKLSQFQETIIDNANVWLNVLDEQANVVIWNKAAEVMSGYSREEVVGHDKIWEWLYPNEEYRREITAKAAAIIEGRDIDKGDETTIRRKDGQARIIAWHSRNLVDQEGNTLGSVALARDVTEQRQAEEALRESEERFRQFFENEPAYCYMVSPQAILLDVNRAALEALGYRKEELVGKPLHVIYPPESLPITERLFQRWKETGELRDEEITIITKQGERRTVILNADAVRDKDGRLLHSLSVQQDITERKRAEQAVHRLMDFNESIIQSMAEVIVVTDSHGDITFANPACAALLGYTVEELVGLPWTRIVPQDQHGNVEAADERRARGETDHYELEVMRQDGERVPVLISGGPRFQAGEHAGTLAVFTDITELKRAEERSRRRSEELAALNAVAASVTSTLNLEQVVEIIEDRVQALLGEKYPPVLGLLDEAEEVFDLVLTSGGARLLAAAGEATGTRLELEELNFPLASVKPDLRAALLAGKPYVTNDASTIVGLGISRKVMQAAQKAVGIECIVGLPLWAKGRLVGGMVLFSQREEISDAQIELLASLGRHAAIAIDNATLYRAAGHEIAQRQQAEEQLRLSHDRLREALDQTVMALSAAGETRDPYTAGHQRGVAELAVEIAEEMGLPEEQIDGLRIAGLIHDIGKIQIPAEILSKPTRLTDPEWSMIKAHPQAGYDILKTVEFPWPVSEMVLQHHERLDGSGYPHGLSGEDILLEARILAVADVVEAMASHRPYRPAHALEETMEEIRSGRGTLYDPEVADACLKLFTETGFKLEEASIRGVA